MFCMQRKKNYTQLMFENITQILQVKTNMIGPP